MSFWGPFHLCFVLSVRRVVVIGSGYNLHINISKFYRHTSGQFLAVVPVKLVKPRSKNYNPT